MQAATLSIIILTYNTKQLTLDAVASVERNYPEEVASGEFEIIVADNESSDGTLDAFKVYKKTSSIRSLLLIANGGNIGFSAGNNKGVSYAKGRYVLFLNPDTIVHDKTLISMVEFMEKHPDVGASSCKLINSDGEVDFNCHRGFPTPWNGFCYFSGLQRMFPRSRLFAGYTQGWKDLSTNHEVDAIEGAFLLTRYEIGKKIDWLDEDYFFYGEDLQFCFDIKKLGLKIYYVGEVAITHIGGAASGIKKKTQNLTIANSETKIKLQRARFDAMRIFYRKNYKKVYPGFIQKIIFKAIDMKEKKTLAGLKI